MEILDWWQLCVFGRLVLDGDTELNIHVTCHYFMPLYLKRNSQQILIFMISSVVIRREHIFINRQQPVHQLQQLGQWP